MEVKNPIRRALVSVYHKDGLDEILRLLNQNGVEILSTGGTADFVDSLGIECVRVEEITGYPSILGGRVKTLHPKIFGGILSRRDNESDKAQIQEYDIPAIDLVIVDLYPFEDTVRSGASEEDIIEKIDIGGISLIRGAAKNFKDVVIIASRNQYPELRNILESQGAATTISQRKNLARLAFGVSSAYDSAIFNYFDASAESAMRLAVDGKRILRYGENPHQKGRFYGDFDSAFTQLHGKEISYNNLLDIDAAVSLVSDFEESVVAILKHNNACGVAIASNIRQAWKDALACDPVSAFGGVIVTNGEIDADTASEINKIFFEVIIAASYSDEALSTLKSKKNRIILVAKSWPVPTVRYRSALNGVLCEDSDLHRESTDDFKVMTPEAPDNQMAKDMIFANILVKHSKSNAIVLAKNGKLLASGVGQTSRVDALRQAITKAKSFGFDLTGAVMASDAFFPFSDCVEIAHSEGIKGVIHPGGSVRDDDSVAYCRNNGMTMVMTGYRHFKH